MTEVSDNVIEIRLDDLANQFIPGLDPDGGKNLIKACAYCFHHHSHKDKVALVLMGAFDGHCIVSWEPQIVDARVLAYWNDTDRAAESGAEGIAILLILAFTDYTIVGRSRKGTGFDYWLGEKDEEQLFPQQGRLEVSGIFHGDNSEINRRTKKKAKQTQQSDHLKIPAYAVVVEFSRPLAKSVGR